MSQLAALKYCSLDTSVAGTYTITFSITYGLYTTTANRTVVVKPSCPTGELISV